MSMEKKRRAAEAALPYIEAGMVLGVGTGSTVAQLIEVLKDRKIQLEGAVSSSRQTSEVLGKFPLPVEVVPMARSYVARQLVKMGGQPVWREGVVTDNGNAILDVHNLRLAHPPAFESAGNPNAGGGRGG